MTIAEFLDVCHDVLVSKIDTFFDEVFVMCEDPELKQNRLRLLNAVASLPRGLFDFSELPGM